MLEIVQQAQNRINASAIHDSFIRQTRTAKSILDFLVSDCLDKSKNKLKNADVKNLSDIYNAKDNLIILSEESNAQLSELEAFLFQRLYMHPSVVQTTNQVRTWVTKLFNKLCSTPELMPGYFRRFIKEYGLERAVCDYIAGMTDRYCLKLLDEI